jgi:hypothetical protein
MSEHATTFHLWLVRETDSARQFCKDRDSSEMFWVPRSVVISITKFNSYSERGDRECQVSIENWFVEQCDEL